MPSDFDPVIGGNSFQVVLLGFIIGLGKPCFPPWGQKNRPCPVEELRPTRITKVEYVDGTTEVIRDNWLWESGGRRIQPRQLGMQWRGTTLFLRLDCGATEAAMNSFLSENPAGNGSGLRPGQPVVDIYQYNRTAFGNTLWNDKDKYASTDPVPDSNRAKNQEVY